MQQSPDTRIEPHMTGKTRNTLCRCNSGKRFKHCHGILTPTVENTTPLPPFVKRAVTKAKPQVFSPADRCVYCGDPNPPLTREHIMPQGLGGRPRSA